MPTSTQSLLSSWLDISQFKLCKMSVAVAVSAPKSRHGDWYFSAVPASLASLASGKYKMWDKLYLQKYLQTISSRPPPTSNIAYFLIFNRIYKSLLLVYWQKTSSIDSSQSSQQTKNVPDWGNWSFHFCSYSHVWVSQSRK